MSEKLTRNMMERALPRGMQINLTDQILDDINAVIDNPGLRENFRDNLIGYVGVLRDGKYRLVEYINAVKYVSWKLLGASNIEAYTKTFPDRFQRMVDEKMEERHIHSVCSAYNRTQLVNKILEQTLVPNHILNQHMYQAALNKQMELMSSPSVSHKVQTDAANSLLTHLKPPEVSRVELDVNVKPDAAIIELQDTIRQLARKQKELILSGDMSAEEVAHSRLTHTTVEGEYVEE